VARSTNENLTLPTTLSVVRGNLDEPWAEYRHQVGRFLRGPPGRGDGVCVWKHVGDAVTIGVDEGIFATAIAIHPQEIPRRIRLDLPFEPANFATMLRRTRASTRRDD
jgi:hypothetical protein